MASAFSKRGMVASEHPLASYVGARVLEGGGSAVDASVAVAMTLSVVLPHLGGIGGDFFALVRTPNGDTVFIDGSGPSPRGLTTDLLRARGYSSMPIHGPHTVTVPGFIDALRLMWEKLGSTEWRELVEPARRIASEGFPTSRSFARASSSLKSLEGPGSGVPGDLLGALPTRAGEEARFPGLARALGEIAEDPRSFYEGPIAESIVEALAGHGGVLGLEDLRSYRAGLGAPLRLDAAGCSFLEMPPPTQGVSTLHMLYSLDRVEAPPNPKSWERVRLLYSLSLPVYRLRDSYVTDPSFMEVSGSDLLSQEILQYLEESWKSPGLSSAAPLGSRPGGDTTFFAVADSEGGLVAGIMSLFHPFGSRIAVPRYQFFLNNRGSSFTLERGHANRLEPGKRTLHTLSAVIADCGDETLVVGTSGGHYRPQIHYWILSNMLAYNMSPAESVYWPRALVDPGTGAVTVEEGIEHGTLEDAEIRRLPHPSRTGVAAILKVRGRVLEAHTDLRGDGIPVGLP